MNFNKYQCGCSKEILRMLNDLVEDPKITELIQKFDEMYIEKDKVNYIWHLISTSLLISENFYKFDKTYQLISEEAISLIEDTLYMYPIVYPDDKVISPCLLDSKNNIADSFLHYIPTNYNPEDFYNYESIEEIEIESEKEYYAQQLEERQQKKEWDEVINKLKIDGPYGCNYSIIEDNKINIRKLIERIRNSLAHSNYEVLDEKNIRLYHYNKEIKKLDFNVILNPNVIVLIIDSLNEIASEKYNNFMESYIYNTNRGWLDLKIDNNLIKKYILSFDILTDEVVDSIIDEINASEVYNRVSKEKKFKIINEIIYKKIKPAYDAGIIINDYLYCNKEGLIISDELYDKYGIFNYLNSDYFSSKGSETTSKLYIQNKIKFLILSLLECSILNGFNINENKTIGNMDFNKMNIDKTIIDKFIKENITKVKKQKEVLENENIKILKEISEKQELINKKRKILNDHYIDNNYFNKILPDEIENINKEIIELKNKILKNITVIEEIEKEGYLYKYNENLSNFIYRHLRNSLAHGFVKFTNEFYINDIWNIPIIFEDYNPNNKKELTFKGKIKLGDLLNIIISKNYLKTVFNIDEPTKEEKNISLLKK